MFCGITDAALMVRVGSERREQALREPHVRPMRFVGRALSGFICIEPDGYAADDTLAGWMQRGLDFVCGLPAKPVRNCAERLRGDADLVADLLAPCPRHEH